MTGKHEAAHLDALRTIAGVHTAHQDRAIADAAADVVMSTDLVEATSAMIGLIVAAEGHAEVANRAAAAASDAKESLRAALCAVLSETSGRARHGIHIADIVNGRAGVVIIDEALIPDEYVRIKKEPDKTKIGVALRQCVDVPGAVLKNSASVLRITVAKEARNP